MVQDNEYAQVDVNEQEESTQEQTESYESNEEETVTIPKSKFNKLKRKATAYDANTIKTSKPITNNSDTKWRERLELKVDGYDDEAIDFILKNGGRKALENPYVVKAVEGIREQRIAERATIDEGSKSTTEKRFSPQEFAKLSNAEQLKVLSELS